MRKVTHEEVDYILNDFERRGIVLDDLRDDLLDHMCCIIECEMTEDDNFYRFYETVLPRFFKEKLEEIQTETDNLLRFKNFYSMIRTMKITGLLTVVFTVIGAIFKTLHLPGAGAMIVLGGFLFSFIFLPLLIALKFRDEESKTDKYVLSFGLLLAIFLAVGLIFKLMHWPGATILMLSGTVGLTFVYSPLYFFTRYRRAELRLNTIVNSVLIMACGGIFFALFNLRNSKVYDDHVVSQNLIMHENSLDLFESNEQLLKAATEDITMTKLHELTQDVDSNLENVVSKIVKPKLGRNIDKDIENLKRSIASYNSYLEKMEGSDLEKLNPESLKSFNQLDNRLCVSILGNMQQRIAVNENIVLTHHIKQ
ncbi:MAG: hypothetical protein R3182_06805 [Draconibacterium sp.]|nr:hypothetical protein [Draconibacterium sp.]